MEIASIRIGPEHTSVLSLWNLRSSGSQKGVEPPAIEEATASSPRRAALRASRDPDSLRAPGSLDRGGRGTPLTERNHLDDIFTWQEERRVTAQLTVHHKRTMYLLEPTDEAKAARPDPRWRLSATRRRPPVRGSLKKSVVHRQDRQPRCVSPP